MHIGKDLVAASSTPLILAIVAEGDTYGYAILKRVAELSGGQLEWTDGMLYPLLHRLERNGRIEGHWGASETGRRRKYYRITETGRAELVHQRRQWQAVDKALRSIWRDLRVVVPVSRPVAARSLWRAFFLPTFARRLTPVPQAA
ncbi:MAG: PadR family transcriptional regulator [Alphaproteobacteria bacterium]|nr:PadR family transcriptional regulator [Alphaproteobacteria bacterium]